MQLEAFRVVSRSRVQLSRSLAADTLAAANLKLQPASSSQGRAASVPGFQTSKVSATAMSSGTRRISLVVPESFCSCLLLLRVPRHLFGDVLRVRTDVLLRSPPPAHLAPLSLLFLVTIPKAGSTL